jgi:4-aminobutyrate aminotransferase/(S)-3-amino-2-methylpropionate transaminase
MKAAPEGFDQCTTTLCGSSANGQLPRLVSRLSADQAENAFKLAFMAYKARERGDATFTEEDMSESARGRLVGLELTV